MKTKMKAFLVSLVILMGILGLKPQVGQTSGSEDHTIFNLTPLWTTGIISDEVGLAGIEVADVNQDNVADIFSCSYGYAYGLNETLPDTYDTIWYSGDIGCVKLAVGDRNANGVMEIYVATSDGKVYIFDGDNFQALGSFVLPSTIAANDIKVANVDGDSTLEIILARSDATLIYNATTYGLEWKADGFGGNELGIGNIDNDPEIEIVVNGTPAHVLNATLKTQEWAYSGGFGSSMDVGDVDDDGRAEIAYIESWHNAYVFEGDTMTINWQRDDLDDIDIVKIADTDGDQIGEVIIGNGQWGNISGYQGSDGADLWYIPNPEHSTSGIGVGDANNDGVQEVLWGAGLTSSGKDALFVGSWVDQTVQWGSDDLDGPLYVASGDLDNDGSVEIVMATASTTSGYEGGTIRVYDGATHQLEWSTVIKGSFYTISQLAVGQLDADAALEILIGGNNWYDTRLQVYDGINLTLEWESPVLGSNGPHSLTVMNVDADPVEEIIIGLDSQNIQILNGASPIVQWDSGSLDGGIRDVALGDLDGNTKLDLAVVTDLSVYVFEVGTWSLKLHETLDYVDELATARVAIANSNLTGPGELLIFTQSYEGSNILQSWVGATHTTLWENSQGTLEINELTVGDFDSDGVQEFALMGGILGESSVQSLLWIGSQNYPLLWEYKMNGKWGSITSLSLADMDDDAPMEFLYGSSTLIQVNDLITTSVTIYDNYMPVVFAPHPPRGLYGKVTENGLPAVFVQLDLRFYDGSSWSTPYMTTTTLDGSYSFMNMPSLGPGQYYYVRYQNVPNSSNPNRLWTWHTQVVDNSIPLNDFHMGDFDLANITLVSPGPDATVNLPHTFQWIPRAASPTDTYEFDLYDPFDFDPYVYTDPPLGYTGAFTLTGLPGGFNDGDLYVWEIWVYSPDGGFGISYEARVVFFDDLVLSITPEFLRPDKTLYDLEDHPSR